LRDRIGMSEIPESWVTIQDMSDDEARQYIRNSLTRSKTRNLMKEAEHYFDDYKASGLSKTEYAIKVGKDNAEMSRILSRMNTGPAIQEFIGKSSLSASIVDEILKTHPDYTLSYLQTAETKGWNTEDTREHLRGDVGDDGKSVVRNPKTKLYDAELKKMPMIDRGAIAKILEDLVQSYNKVATHLESSGYPELSFFVSTSIIKSVMKVKNMFDGTHNIIPKDRTQPIIRVNAVRQWVLDPDPLLRQRRQKQIERTANKIYDTRGEVPIRTYI